VTYHRHKPLQPLDFNSLIEQHLPSKNPMPPGTLGLYCWIPWGLPENYPDGVEKECELCDGLNEWFMDQWDWDYDPPVVTDLTKMIDAERQEWRERNQRVNPYCTWNQCGLCDQRRWEAAAAVWRSA